MEKQRTICEPLLKPKANPLSLPLSVLIPFIFLCKEVLIRRNYLIYMSIFVSTFLNVSLMRAGILSTLFAIIFSVHLTVPGP